MTKHICDKCGKEMDKWVRIYIVRCSDGFWGDITQALHADRDVKEYCEECFQKMVGEE